MLIDIQKISSLEDYCISLGVLCVSVQTLVALQEKAQSLGIFDNDETEASKMVQYAANRLFITCDDLLRMTTARTGQEWDDFRDKMLQQAKKMIEKDKNSKGRKKK